jgi:hypothetical protein
MHGAFATGLREAANIMAAFAQQRGEELRPQLMMAAGELPQLADPACVAAGQQLVKLAELLQQVGAASTAVRVGG